MKNLSTFQAVLIGVFVLAALFGMAIFATYSGGGNKAQKIGKVVIWGVLPQTPVRSVLNELSQTNKGLQGVSYVFKPQTEFVSDLTTAIANGHAPDLILLSQADLNTLADTITSIPYSSISQRAFINKFADAGTVYMGPDGIYGMPIGIDPLILYDNRTLLSSAGIAAPPKTWDEFSGLVPHVVQTTSSHSISRALIALGSYDNVHDALGILSTLFLQAGIPIVSLSARDGYKVALGSANVTSSVGGIPPGEAVVNFYTSFADPTTVSYTWNRTLPNSQQMFLSGNEALYLGYASEGTLLTRQNPNLSFDVSPVPQPQTVSHKTVYARVYALAIPHGSRNQKGAFMAAIALSNNTAQRTFADTFGFAPASRSLLAAPPNNPVSSVVYPAAIMASTWLSPQPQTTNSIFSGMIQSVLNGSISISQALANAEREISASLQ